MTEETKQSVTKQAILDAIGFCEEFPNETIGEDWGSQSFQVAANELELPSEELDEAWVIYRDSLYKSASAMLGRS